VMLASRRPRVYRAPTGPGGTSGWGL
jgi:hypothetical protein